MVNEVHFFDYNNFKRLFWHIVFPFNIPSLQKSVLYGKRLLPGNVFLKQEITNGWKLEVDLLYISKICFEHSQIYEYLRVALVICNTNPIRKMAYAPTLSS